MQTYVIVEMYNNLQHTIKNNQTKHIINRMLIA